MIQKVRVQTNGEKTIKVYRLEGISEKEANILAEKLLSEKINQIYTINKTISSDVIEIAYKPGVMNPEVASIMKAAEDLNIKLLACDSSKEYLDKYISFNPLTEHIVKEEPKTLLIEGKVGKIQVISLQSMNDEQLLNTSKDKLFLNLEEMKIIQKISKVLLKLYPGLNILQNNKKVAGQAISHLHFHLIPRYDNDGIKIDYWETHKYGPEEDIKLAKKIKTLLK